MATSFPKLSQHASALVLAPMEGVTDAPMRALQSKSGAFTFCVSEFIRVCEHPVPKKVFYREVPELLSDALTPHGTPVQAQLLGGNPETIAASALNAIEAGAKAIDLNFGCPAPTVNRHDGGATLLKFPHRIRYIVRAVRNAVPLSIPVSAKLRLGWDDIQSVHTNASEAAEGGADWITLHGRTRMAGYQPPIFWEPIGEVRKRLFPLPVVANGDIWTIEDFKRCQQITGCQHFMIGRGALADPMLPVNIAAELKLKDFSRQNPMSKNPKDWVPLLESFATYLPISDDKILTRRTKLWISLAHRFGQVDWFDQIKRLETFPQIRETINNL